MATPVKRSVAKKKAVPGPKNAARKGRRNPIGPVKKGALHKQMGKPAKEPISDSELAAQKAKAKRTGNSTLMKRVVFAQNARKWKHTGRKKG